MTMITGEKWTDHSPGNDIEPGSDFRRGRNFDRRERHGCEVHGGFRRVQPLHGRDEPVAAFGQGFDVAGVFGGVGQRFAYLIDRRAQAVVEVDHGLGAPDLLLQFLAGNDFSRTAEQDGQQLKRLTLQLDANAALP